MGHERASFQPCDVRVCGILCADLLGVLYLRVHLGSAGWDVLCNRTCLLDTVRDKGLLVSAALPQRRSVHSSMSSKQWCCSTALLDTFANSGFYTDVGGGLRPEQHGALVDIEACRAIRVALLRAASRGQFVRSSFPVEPGSGVSVEVRRDPALLGDFTSDIRTEGAGTVL